MGAGAGLIAFVVLAVMVQRVSGVALLAVVLAANGFALWMSGKRLRSLMRRSRFLFLAVAVLYSFFTPGARLWIVGPVPSPTIEGVFLALEYSARLAGVLALVCILVERYPRDELIGGMLACLASLRRIRVPIERAALRMSIVLEMVSAPEGLPNWRACFASKVDAKLLDLPVVVVHLPRWRGRDVSILLVLIAVSEFVVRVSA